MTLRGYDVWKLDTPPRFEDGPDADGTEDPADDEADGEPAGQEDDD